VQLNLHNSGGLNLLFQDKSGDSASGASCEFNLQAALLHGLLHLIEQSLKKAQWQQPDFSQRSEHVESSHSERPSYRH
jgi:ribosomal protein S12 methylthiotransferase accessory factor YcaO